MSTITLLSSFHLQRGKCNPSELYKIIEQIQPEIIFEELPYDVFNIVYADGFIPQSLEAFTIKHYLQKYQVKHFPVDTYEFNEADMFSGYDIISQNSNEYDELFKQNLAMVTEHGYPYVNSADQSARLEQMRTIEQNVLAAINDEKLSWQYKLEREIFEKREHEMLQNIYGYSKQYPYQQALFICGAEHRKSIMEKIPAKEEKEGLQLNWILYNG